MIPEHMWPYQLFRNIGRLIIFLFWCCFFALMLTYVFDSMSTFFEVLGA